MLKKYCVYAHIAPDGKIYVGITSREPEKRWGKRGEGYYCQPFYFAMQEYGGFDAFSHLILVNNCTEEEALSFEKAFIKEYNATNPDYGFNVAEEGFSISSQHPPVICLETGEQFSSIYQASRRLKVNARLMYSVMHMKKSRGECRGEIYHESKTGNSYTVESVYYHLCYLDELTDTTEVCRKRKIKQLDRLFERYRKGLMLNDIHPSDVYMRYRSWLDKKRNCGF